MKALLQGAFGRRTAGQRRAKAVAHEQQYSFVTKLAQAHGVGGPLVERFGVEAPVAGVNDPTDWGVYYHAAGLWHGVRNAHKLDCKRAELDAFVIVHIHDLQIRLVL